MSMWVMAEANSIVEVDTRRAGTELDLIPLWLWL
jgi:hypothetical protein